MLQQRIITAIVLLAFLLPAVFYPDPTAFMGVAVVLITAGAWEWSNLNQCKPFTAYGMAALSAVGCLAMWYSGFALLTYRSLWLVAAAVWVLGSVWLLRGGVGVWARLPQVVRVVIGLLALWVAWLAVVQARVAGINFLVSVMVLVFTADVFAYFAGRAVGGRFIKTKLAPTISPGKTWEGAFGGFAASVIGALCMYAVSRNYPALHFPTWTFWHYAYAGVVLSVASQIGDLAESVLKRDAGVKDSGNFFPGHGGVLDRCDGFLFAAPFLYYIALFSK